MFSVWGLKFEDSMFSGKGLGFSVVVSSQVKTIHGKFSMNTRSFDLASRGGGVLPHIPRMPWVVERNYKAAWFRICAVGFWDLEFGV